MGTGEGREEIGLRIGRNGIRWKQISHPPRRKASGSLEAVPLSPRELVARLRAQIRCASRLKPEDVYVFEDVMVDLSKSEITRTSRDIKTTNQSAAISCTSGCS